MCSRVSEHAKRALQEVGKSPLLILRAFGCQRIDRQHWRITGQRMVHEYCAVVSETGSCSEFIGDALGCLQYPVKIIVGEQFSPAEAQNV